jgi:hypothetical protein
LDQPKPAGLDQPKPAGLNQPIYKKEEVIVIMEINQFASTVQSFHEFCETQNFIISNVEKKILCDTEIVVDEEMLEWLGYNGRLKNKNMCFKRLIYDSNRKDESKREVIPHTMVTINSTTFIALSQYNLISAIMKMKTERADYVRKFLQDMFFMEGRYANYCKQKIELKQNHISFLQKEKDSLKRKSEENMETYKYQINPHLVTPPNNKRKRSGFCIIDYSNGSGYAIRRLHESFVSTKQQICQNHPHSKVALELYYCANPISLYNNIKNYVYENLNDQVTIVGNNIVTKNYNFRKFIANLLQLSDFQRVRDSIVIYGEQLVIKDVLNDLLDKIEVLARASHT